MNLCNIDRYSTPTCTSDYVSLLRHTCYICYKCAFALPLVGVFASTLRISSFVIDSDFGFGHSSLRLYPGVLTAARPLVDRGFTLP